MSEQSSVKETLEKALQDGLNALKETLDLPALETLRNAYLSKKGIFTAHMQALAKASAEERPQLGKIINDAKTRFQQALQEKMDAFKEREMAEKLASERVDVSLAGRQAFKGGLHPVTLTRRRIEDWFARLGFVVKDGPEIEDDFHNFTALNIPEHHPARAMQDTFYFDPQTVLRTHTSGVQIRTMEQEGAPLRIIAPGRVYRSDSDVTHTPMFHQVEGVVVDTSSTFADFPFTEPSAEVDIAFFTAGDGANVKWLEVLGCGMVHPQVLRNSDVDPDIYQGYAFGMGIERLAMLRYGVQDLRQFFENDVRFLRQFRNEF